MLKKIIIILLILVIGFILGAIITLKSLEIDGLEETAENIVTIKVFNNYIDYEYKEQ